MSNVYHVFMCWKCGEIILIEGAVARSAVCENCGADVRCCKNCTFYEPGSHYDCHETIDELVKDKESANFCGFFKLNSNVASNNYGSAYKKAQDAKNTFNSLFGD